MSTRKIYLFLPLIILGFISCNSSETPVEERAARAAKMQGDIVIGIVDSSTNSSLFLEGVNLAVEELNQRGGVLGRRIKTLVRNDGGDKEKGQQIARKLATNLDVVAVVGHVHSKVAIPASIIYEKHGILFLSPGASDPNLTRYGANFTFRNIPTDEDIGRLCAELSYRSGVKKGVIFYQREGAYKRLIENFGAQSGDLGTELATARSFFGTEDDFRSVLSEVKKEYTFDGIFIAGRLPAAGILIKQARDMGIEALIMATKDLDSPRLWTDAGKAAEGTIVATVFDPNLPTRLTRDFVKRFKAQYGLEPDTWAAQGYDGIQVLAHAMDKGGSTVPIVMASTLRFLEHWEGVTGSYGFTRNGDITGKSIFFKEARNGGFKFLERDIATEAQVDPLYVIEDFTLRIPLGTPILTLDPGLSNVARSEEVLEQLFLGLTDLDPETYQPVPELATSWSVSEDGKTYIFHLRRDVTWTDGTPVNAHDLVWTIQRNAALEIDSSRDAMWDLRILQNAEAINRGDMTDPSQIGVRAIDDFTVEFTLEYAAAYFPSLAGLPMYRPLPRHLIETYGDAWTDPNHFQSNGSYSLVGWKEGTVMILRKNPDYYDADKVRIPEIRYYVIPEPAVGLAMYKNNEVDILGGTYLSIPPKEIPRIKTDPLLRQEYSKQQKSCLTLGTFNMIAPVDRPLVRKAISSAIDRQLLVDLILTGEEQPATTIIPPWMVGGVDPQEEGIGIDFNPEQAQAWLAEAGYPDGQGFPELQLLSPPFEPYIQIAQAIQASLWHHLQIEVNYFLKFSEEDRNRRQPPHMTLEFECANFPSYALVLLYGFRPQRAWVQSPWEHSGFADEYASLMDKVLMSSDREEITRLAARAQQILAEEEVFFFPLYFDTAHALVKPRVNGWYHMGFGGQHIRDWSLQE